MPFISVIVPVYNVEQYLRRCVESLTAQNYKDCEILLVDDGSTDASGALCDALAAEYVAVTAFHKENGGLGSARNHGIKNAHGAYITFIDSDDYVTSDYFEFLDAHLKEHRCDLLKYGYRKIRDGESLADTVPYFFEDVYERERIKTELLPGAVGPIRLFDYAKTPLLSACVCAYRLDFLKKHDIEFRSEREILSEDYLFNYAALLNAQRVEISHKILYFYDFREGSLTKRYKTEMLPRMLNLQNAYKAELQKAGLYECYRDSYYSMCVDGFYACITNECCGWNMVDKKLYLKNVREILQLPQCRAALKKCNHKNMSLKGRAIYYLMRWRWAALMCFLYKKVTSA